MAYVSLVQAVELLLKDILFKMNPCLVLENIVIPKEDKSVSANQAINRVSNLKLIVIGDEEKKFLINCIRIRNEYIHYRVNIITEELKPRYCKLFSIYSSIHQQHKGYSFPDEKRRIFLTLLNQSRYLQENIQYSEV